MYRIKLSIEGEERSLLYAGYEYFRPNPLDKMCISFSHPRWGMGGEADELRDYYVHQKYSNNYDPGKYVPPADCPFHNKNEYMAWHNDLYDWYNRNISWRTRPGSKIIGGIFNVVMESTDDDDLFYYLLEDECFFNGQLSFYRLDEGDNLRLFDIGFWDCRMVNIREICIPDSPYPMLLCVRFSPAITRNRGLVHHKGWHMTDIKRIMEK